MDKQRSWIVVSVVLLLFASVALLLLTVHVDEIQEPPQYMYGVVLDAGSSHTTVYVYRWPADKQNGTGVVTQHSECKVKGGGISSYAGQQGAAGRSLEACLNQAMVDIPPARHHLTPVYLGATAGMRLLNISSPEKSMQVLQEVAATIKSFPFKFQTVKILSGKEEGAYGWVTVNYLLENFIKYGFVGRWLNSGRQTVGALDLGGASTQITFVSKEKIEDLENSMTLRLYGQDYSLYTHSYLCYGQNEVLRRLLAHLLTTQDVTGVVHHPCYPSDHRETLNLQKVFESPCITSQRPAVYNPETSAIVQGTGNYQHCLGNISEIFSFQNCLFSQCSFDGVFQPNTSGSFMAFSAFFFTHSFMKKSTGIYISTPDHLRQAAQSVCNMTFVKMSKDFPEQKSYLKDYCAVTVYIQVLMLRGYRFDDQSFPRVSFQKKAGDSSLGWSLGYMLSMSSMLPEESVNLRRALHPGAWISLLLLIALLISTTLFFIILQVCHKKRSNV
ncbi:ectonucleoside triphosphate diphosphohydrolase 2 [Tachysurus fulvidraco]|uniref:ectonucleoside triphosphate diphosphohydrolase 2 n=1 Tax=Tachysurus fulvidraco TaxID=1234273 RepID=UPI001FF06F8B|nr:ectonucleoside triphosphate diphosphohydrolase 2 [Tachysurus fulvidraco]